LRRFLRMSYFTPNFDAAAV